MNVGPIEAAVLVVDDVPENLLQLETLLRQPGRLVVTSPSGEDALDRIEERDFAVALLDVRLPGISGFEVAERIRAIPRTRTLPIIFVTGIETEARQVFRGYETGAVDYLFQPVDPHVLRSKVAVFCELWIQRRVIEDQNTALRAQMEEIDTLRGLIPVCANCKKIRDDQGFWHRFELYIMQRSRARFSHGLCEECAETLYPELHASDVPGPEAAEEGSPSRD